MALAHLGDTPSAHPLPPKSICMRQVGSEISFEGKEEPGTTSLILVTKDIGTDIERMTVANSGQQSSGPTSL